MFGNLKLGFGCMRLPITEPDNFKAVDIAQVERMVDEFIARGFTYFDTAYMYHDFESERIMRETLVKRHPRTAYTLTTKLPVMMIHSDEDQRRIFDEQLEKCGVDYFDYYLLHSINLKTYSRAKRLDSFGFIAEKRAEGKVRHIGLSFHDTADLLDEILTEHPEMEFVQLQINYLDWENESIQSRKCYEVARKHNKPIIVMEPVKGGTLAKVTPEAEALMRGYHPDRSIASWAIRYVASLEGIEMVLSGMSNYEQLDDNTLYMRHFEPLNDDERAIIDKTVEMLNAAIPIQCTACRYCVKGCPKHIAIPEYFNLYNANKQSLNHLFSTQQFYYDTYTTRHGRASDCIACRKCESVCPQHLPIVEHLKRVSQMFDKR